MLFVYDICLSVNIELHTSLTNLSANLQ